MRNSVAVLAPLLFTASLLLGDEQKQSSGPAFSVRGRVVDETGQPIAVAEVESLEDGAEASSRTDDAGRFVLDLARKPAVLLLRANEPQGRQAFAAFLLDARSVYPLDRFPGIKSGLPDEITLVARPPRKIAAVVVDGQKQPVAGAEVLVHAAWHYKISAAKTEAHGRAALVLPVDAPLSSIVAMKAGVGLDYFLYQTPQAESRYRLAHDHAGPVTFVLNGSRRITVKVVDEAGQPLRDVKVYPISLEKPRKGKEREVVNNSLDGGALYTNLVDDFSAATNAEGAATFDYVPADCMGGVTFIAGTWDRRTTDLAHVEAGGENADTTLTLYQTLPLRGQVIFDDGRSAADVMIHVLQQALDDGREAGLRGFQNVTLFTDEQGKFIIGAFANHFQWLNISCKDKAWAAPLTTAIVLNDPPEPLKIVLQKATHVYGRLTAGPDNRLLPKQRISVYRRVDDVYRQLHDRGLAFKEEAKPRRGFRANAAPVAPANEVKLMFAPSSITTDNDGRFDVPLGSGKYQLRYGETVLDLELDGETEKEVNLHVERPTHVEFAGRVVFEGGAQKGVASAYVRAYFLSQTGHYTPLDTTTNEKGLFRFARHPVDMLLYARDEDGQFANVVRVAADDQTAIVTLSKAASAQGRLIDAATGEPLRNARVRCGISLDGRSTLYDNSRGVQTDERGEFTIAGLVPGQTYMITLHHNLPRGRHLTTLEPPSAAVIELGDFRVDATGKITRDSASP